MSERKRALTIAALIAILALAGPFLVGTSRSQEPEDIWSTFVSLVGKWKGEGSGFGGVSVVTHQWEFVLQEQFLRLRTRSVSRPEDGAEEIHEDVGFLSRDTDRGAVVFRQFLSEGFVNTFDVTFAADGKPTIVFGDRDSESAGGMRARMRLSFTTEDEYEMVLELAAPGKDFAPCQQMAMKRVP